MLARVIFRPLDRRTKRELPVYDKYVEVVGEADTLPFVTIRTADCLGALCPPRRRKLEA